MQFGLIVEISGCQCGNFKHKNWNTTTVENMNPQCRDYSGSSLINSYVYKLINLLILMIMSSQIPNAGTSPSNKGLNSTLDYYKFPNYFGYFLCL